MRTVGLRELRNRLSEYVRFVRKGEHVQVTDRGQVVAEIVPAGSVRETEHPGLAWLIARGLRPGLPNEPAAYPVMPRVVPDGTAQRLLDEDRG